MPPLSFEKQIKQRAYELFLERGGADGDDHSDWFRAESEIRSTSTAKKPSLVKQKPTRRSA